MLHQSVLVEIGSGDAGSEFILDSAVACTVRSMTRIR